MEKNRLLDDANSASGMKSYEWLLGVGLWVWNGCASLPTVAVSKDPLSSSEHKMLAGAYAAHGEENLAKEQYEAALTKDPHDVSALMALGNAAFNSHDFKKARYYFQRVSKEPSGGAAAQNNLAMVDMAEGKWSDARARIEKALPDSGSMAAYFWDTLANIDIAEGRLTEAKEAVDKAEDLTPASDPAFSKHIQQTRNALLKAINSPPSPRAP